MRAARALSSLRNCADSTEPSLLPDAISTEIICSGLFRNFLTDRFFCKLNINNLLDWTVLNEYSHKMNATSNLQCTNKYTVKDKMYPCILADQYQPKCVTFLVLCFIVNFYHRNLINGIHIILLPFGETLSPPVCPSVELI